MCEYQQGGPRGTSLAIWIFSHIVSLKVCNNRRQRTRLSLQTVARYGTSQASVKISTNFLPGNKRIKLGFRHRKNHSRPP